MILCAEPASILVIDSTAGSVTAMRRATKVWSAVTISHATGTGSMQSCGIAAWPPAPRITACTVSADAMIDPLRVTTSPAGAFGVMCSAKAASGAAMSSRPSSIMKRAP